MAKTEGDENKAKALYIETRVEEMKDEIRRRMYAEAQAQKEKKLSLLKNRLIQLMMSQK